MTPFETWWYHEGSQGPTAGNDLEEHCMRMCKIAWEKSAQAEREACAKLVDDIEARCVAKDVDSPPMEHVSAAIREGSIT